MPTGFKVLFISFGVLFFLAHLVMFIARLRRAKSGRKRVEAGGVLVTGAVGLLVVAGAFVRSLPLAVTLGVLGLLLLVLGPFLYELIVFRPNTRANHGQR